MFDCIVASKVLSVARNKAMTEKHPIKHRDDVCLDAAAGFKATLTDWVTKSETRARECAAGAAWVFLQTLIFGDMLLRLRYGAGSSVRRAPSGNPFGLRAHPRA